MRAGYPADNVQSEAETAPILRHLGRGALQRLEDVLEARDIDCRLEGRCIIGDSVTPGAIAAYIPGRILGIHRTHPGRCLRPRPRLALSGICVSLRNTKQRPGR